MLYNWSTYLIGVDISSCTHRHNVRIVIEHFECYWTVVAPYMETAMHHTLNCTCSN